MDSKELEKRLAKLQAAVTAIQMKEVATRIAFAALAKTHPDKAALAAQFDKQFEHAIADTLTRTYPEDVVDLFRGELEGLKALLHEIAQEDNQGNEKR
jgi:hypothetical protein